MPYQEAVLTVPAPLPEVEARLRQVDAWPRFLAGLRRACRTGPDRYRFTVHDGARPRDVDVTCLWSADHTMSWRSLCGPATTGEICLLAVDDASTQVRLSLAADESATRAGLAELFGPSPDTAEGDLRRFSALLGTAV